MVDELPWGVICEQAAGPVAVLTLQARYHYVNPAFCELLGFDRDYILQRTPQDFFYPGDPVVDRELIDEVIADPVGRRVLEKRYIRADGSVIWILINGAIIRDDGGQPLFFLEQFHDVSAKHESEVLWRETVTNAPIGMAIRDLDGNWREVNDKLCELVGYTRDELLSMRFTDLTYPDDVARAYQHIHDLASGRREVSEVEKRYRHKDGYPLWMLVRSSLVRGPDGQPAYLVSQYELIGSGRMNDAHLAHMALHDPLTGLANRALLSDRLEHELSELTSRGGVLAIVLADLDELKQVNDEYGHLVGDQLILATAHALLNAVGPGDTVARYGGDEFVVLTHTPDQTAAEIFRDRVTRSLRTKIVVSGHPVELRASVGLATTEDPSTSAQALLNQADRRMYTRKKSRPRHR